MVLFKRIFRDLRANFFRWAALMLLIVISMYVVVSMVSSADTVTKGVLQFGEDANVEDGEFTVFVPLSEKNIADFEDKGIHIKEMFYLDFELEDHSTIRVFRLRDDIDVQLADAGEEPSDDSEIMLEKHYALFHEIEQGDSISIADTTFRVSGYGVSPDYDNVTNNITDIGSDPQNFGIGFVTDKAYETLAKSPKLTQSEVYLYAYTRKSDAELTDKELKEELADLEYDTDLINDKYIQDQLKKAEKEKKKITDGIDSLRDGSNELTDAVREFRDGTSDLYDGAKELNDGTAELTDGIEELYKGVDKLRGNSSQLVSGADTIFAGLLANAQQQLADAGITVTLTPDNYRNALANAPINNPTQNATNAVNGLIDSLSQYEQFYNSLLAYTGGVDQTSQAAQMLQNSPIAAQTAALTEGLQQLSNNSNALNQGAGQVFDAMLANASQQLAAKGLSVSLTRSNYGDTLAFLPLDGVGVQTVNSINALEDNLRKTETFVNGVKAYTDGVDELYEGIEKLRDATDSLTDGTQELEDGAKELYTNAEDLLDGSEELEDGIQELSDNTDELIDKAFDDAIEIDNLTMFLERDNNPRIAASADDVNINKVGGIIGGIILMILIAYVISVFIIHNVNEDSVVIGTLYSMGISQRMIRTHYIILPMLVTLIGGIIGAAIGFSPVGVGSMMEDHAAVYSFPTLETVVPPYLIIYSVVFPPVVTAIVISIVIRKRLNRTPLSLLRKTTDEKNASRVKVRDDLSFLNAFRIRQILREIRSSITLFFGMFISMLILVLGVVCMVAIDSLGTENERDIRFENMYLLKYEPEDVPEHAEKCYVEELKKETLGYDLDVTLMGITDENPYFQFDVPKEKNEIIVGSSTAIKFGLHVGDMVYFTDEINDIIYTFKVAGIEQYSVGLHIFMDIDNMRELFEQEKDYYNVLMSTETLDIDPDYVYNITTKRNLIRFAGIFRDSMGGMVSLLLGSSIVVFIVVMYLMIKVMIDRSSFHISLIKTFGFTDKEVRKMYLDGNFLTVIISGIISVPLSKLIMDGCWLLLCSNIAGGFNTHIPIHYYAGIFCLIIGCYLLVSGLLMMKLKRISPADVLKDRE